MKKLLETKLWDSFIEMLRSPTTMESYRNYYSALVSWIKNNSRFLGEEFLKRDRLDVLLKLDPDVYIVDQPGIDLNMELKRLGSIKPHRIDTFAMVIENTLWDMVTIRTRKYCPICIDDELRFLLSVDKFKNEEKLILECETCGWCEYTNGSKWNEGYAKVVPASRQDLIRFGMG